MLLVFAAHAVRAAVHQCPATGCDVQAACDNLPPGVTMCLGCTTTTCDALDRRCFDANDGNRQGCPSDYYFMCTMPIDDRPTSLTLADEGSKRRCDGNGRCICVITNGGETNHEEIATPVGAKTIAQVKNAQNAAWGSWGEQAGICRLTACTTTSPTVADQPATTLRYAL